MHYEKPFKIYPVLDRKNIDKSDVFRDTWLFEPIESGQSRTYRSYALLLTSFLGLLLRFKKIGIWFIIAILFFTLTLGPI